MAKVGVSLKINLNMMDQARIFQGQKGQYLDATVFIDLEQLDQYGNSGMITQDVSKEEKQRNINGNILGNCKVFWSDSGQLPMSSPQQQQQQPAPQQHNQQQAQQQQQPQQYNQAQQQQYNQQQQAPHPNSYQQQPAQQQQQQQQSNNGGYQNNRG